MNGDVSDDGERVRRMKGGGGGVRVTWFTGMGGVGVLVGVGGWRGAAYVEV